MRSTDSAGIEVFEVHAIGPGRWAAELVRPDAATLAGLGVDAVLDDLTERQVVAVTTHFLWPAAPGGIEITVGHIDRVAARTTTDARIQQAGRVLARLLVTTNSRPDADRPEL